MESGLSFLLVEPYIKTMHLIEKVCHDNDVDDSHGLPHAIEIACHVKKAIDSMPAEEKLSAEEQENVMLASLLHDVDDHKYFKTKNYDNARFILGNVLANEERIAKIVRMVDLVSFSKNGNQINEKDPIAYYFPRYADRVESIGLIGIYRTYLYSQRTKRPFFTEKVPKPQTKEQAYKQMQGKDKIYISRGGNSDSVIDHFFQKLLHIKLPQQIKNTYLEQVYQDGHDYIVDFLLMHSQTGYANAEKDLLERVSKDQRPDYSEVLNYLHGLKSN